MLALKDNTAPYLPICLLLELQSIFVKANSIFTKQLRANIQLAESKKKLGH